MEKNSKCRICDAELYIVWSLRKAPYGDLFNADKNIAQEASKKEINLSRCTKCNLLQLSNQTDIELQYDNYLYLTKNTNMLSKFYTEISNKILYEYQINQSKVILDIGSNDGTFLRNFKEKEFEVLGIDPAFPASEFANKNKITTINEYFSLETITKHSLDQKKYSLISINYTLANIPDLKQFIINLEKLMDDDTILSIISGYHPDQFAINMFDYIGHDHLIYFTICDLSNLAERFGLKLLDVTRHEHKGGSVNALFAKKKSRFEVKSSVKQSIQRELWVGANNDALIYNMVKNIMLSKQVMKNFLESYKNHKVVGVGASISTSYLLNEFEIYNSIFKLYDDDVNKIGKYSPFYGIKVDSLNGLKKENPDLVIILAWQHVNKLIDRLREINYSGLVVVPLPEFRIYYLN